jgi:hypothetical protein
MNIKNVLVFTVLTILVPLTVQALIKQPIPTYQFIDPIRFIVYFIVGFIGAMLTLATFTLSDAAVGTVIGILIYPVDTVSFLISNPSGVAPQILFLALATILGAYVGSKMRGGE